MTEHCTLGNLTSPLSHTDCLELRFPDIWTLGKQRLFFFKSSSKAVKEEGADSNVSKQGAE